MATFILLNTRGLEDAKANASSIHGSQVTTAIMAGVGHGVGSKLFGLQYIPHTVVINNNGIVQMNGPLSPSQDKDLLELLNKPE